MTFVMILALNACGGGGGNSTVLENNNSTTSQSTTALEKVKEIIVGNTTVTVSADELNSIDGIDGAIVGKDYTSALRHGTYADSHNPTVSEIQAVIDHINKPPVNHTPSITGTPSTTILKNKIYTFTPIASDEDNDTLSFNITNKPSWAKFETSTGKLSGTPLNSDVGTTSNIVISVSDGIKSATLNPFTITVKETNKAPTITGTPNTSINADSSYTFTPSTRDEDSADTLTFSINKDLTQELKWVTFDTATGKLSGTPSNADAGITSGIIISVSDGTVSTALPAFSIEVKYVNHAPTITGTPATAIQADNLYTFIPSTRDEDSADTLSFSISNKPTWATFDTATGKLSGTPSNADVGTTSGIVISVSDKIKKTSLASFNITVKLTNHAPTITGTPNTNIDADSSYTFTPIASDEDNDTLTFSIINKPSWASFDTATGKLSGTPHNVDAGTTSGIVISVSDGTVSKDLPAFSIEVKYVNHAPTITGTPITNIDADSSYTFTPTANDDDNDTLTFSIINKPSWASFDTATGKLSGTPHNADADTTSGIVISVSDGTVSENLPAFTLEVIYHVVSCGSNSDKGYSIATSIPTGKKITKVTSSTNIRLWHTSDGLRKICVINGEIKVQ